MKNGDIYHWAWRDGSEPEGMNPYWSKSQIAMFLNDKLYDTFWMHHGSKFLGSGGWGPAISGDVGVLDPDRIVLSYVANLDNLIEVRWAELQYYDPADFVDLRHSNNSRAPAYIRKGAWRSAEAIRRLIEQRRTLANLQIEDGRRAVARLDRAETLLRTGMLDQIEL